MDFKKTPESAETTKRKRERSVNFTEQETNILLSLVEAKKYIIECKKSDATTWQEKEKAWKEIEIAFHSISNSVFRDQKHLKIKYEAIKRDTRKKIAMVQESYINGGGAGTTPVLTPAEHKVMEIIHSVEGNESFDPDVLFPNESDTASRAENPYKQWKEWNPTPKSKRKL
ncbi:hypothetical protein ABMA28_016926 [Loxostege sticticalis]|uniref:Regulatory protein zeste n=1 Tax=Loxostege sticticalis TaxID=481309 RepID=A0ABD0T6D2_LOXSC